MAGEPSSDQDQVRTSEVIAALCLATDLGMGLPFEHGLQSTLVAMRLAERLGVDSETALQTYYGCLLFYVGCTADAEVVADLFDDGALAAHWAPVMFGTPAQSLAGIARALAGPAGASPSSALRAAGRLPKAVRGHRQHLDALCQVAQMLSDRLGMPESVRRLFLHLTERWDGRGEPGRLRGDELPLALRICHVARDAAFQRLLGGEQHAVAVVRERSGAAFDPDVVACLVSDAGDVLALDDEVSAWPEALAREPMPRLALHGEEVDRALAAMGDFADLVAPCLVGHSAGVAELAAAAAERCGFRDAEVLATRRASLVHDVGRVAVPARIWQKPGPLTPDEWERVRLHAYHSERVLCRSPFLNALTPAAAAHHERLDGSGYHRGVTAAVLTAPARLLAAADAYRTKTEPRPHRQALSPPEAAEVLRREAAAGRLDGESVAAVLEVSGHRAARVSRPAGLTEREAEVVVLLARGLQTKQVARALGISAKTADHHVQNAYAKIGVSTRAAAALFAMQNGLAVWGELPMVGPGRRS